ncbi:MAG: AMP-binding protein, partial [Solirubrobacterales bacterium]|nr:AMP-binding protein [Solirubrobacterales bacterium]
MFVDAWLPRAAARHPGRPAVNAMTYAELLERASGRVPPAGARVGIALPPGEEFAVALHACLLGGALAVPLDLRLTEAEWPATDVRWGEHEAGAVQERHDLDAPAILVHTSGTTSAPKPVHLTYGNWLWSALGSAVALGLDQEERWLCTLPLSHVGGLSILLRSAIYGTTAIVHERFDTERVLAELRRPDGPTIVSLVPTTLARLMDAGLREP